MVEDKDKKLEDLLDDQVTDEFSAIVKYDEILEKMPKDHTQHIEMLREIQKQQSVHGLELANIMMDMNFREPKMVKKLEEFIDKKGYIPASP